MKPFALSPLKLAALGLAVGIGVSVFAGPEITLKGLGYGQYGRVQHSSDTATLNYNGNFIHTSAAQLTAKAEFSPQLEIMAGLGMLEQHYLAGTVNNSSGRVYFMVTPYVSELNATYSFWNDEDSKLRVTAGFYPYNYNPDVKNLGLYLLRGPVYPGVLISGFESKHIAGSGLANLLGFQIQFQSGSWTHDFLLNSDIEYYPYFDFSPAYLVHFKVGEALTIGTGVNFFHYLPIENRMTSPDTLAFDNSDAQGGDPYNRSWIYVDTLTQDTTFLSFKGTKIMAHATLDIKVMFGNPELLGPEDLKLYSEVAVVGLEQNAAYKAIYGDLKKRIPIMVGFNFPAFGLLDHLSLETEWYGADFPDDLTRYQSSTAKYPSPIPALNPSGADLNRDDIKWSIHAAKTMGHVRLSAQVANDHSRPGGKLYSPSAEWQALFVTPKDWYWMTKLGFFF